jgi:hypothetical protein
VWVLGSGVREHAERVLVGYRGAGLLFGDRHGESIVLVSRLGAVILRFGGDGVLALCESGDRLIAELGRTRGTALRGLLLRGLLGGGTLLLLLLRGRAVIARGGTRAAQLLLVGGGLMTLRLGRLLGEEPLETAEGHHGEASKNVQGRITETRRVHR